MDDTNSLSNKKVYNICVMTYYGLRDSLFCVGKAITGLNQRVFNYSLLENYNKKSDEFDYKADIIDYMDNYKIDIVLWWHINIPSEDFNFIVSNLKSNNPKILSIYYNWDEPFNWGHCDLKNKAKSLDMVFVCCEETLYKYLENGTKEAYWLLPSYDEDINNITMYDHRDDYNYICDISFICTNLYIGNDYTEQLYPRKDLIDKIYEGNLLGKYKFDIYGPEFLKEFYPESYRGYIHYEKQNILFNKSKINLTTHVIGNKNKYLNERTIMIAGSGGLLMIDNVKGLNDIFEINKDCIIIDYDGIQNQIVDILDNYEKYIQYRLNIKEKSKSYTWKIWAKFIFDKIDLFYKNV